MHARGRDAQLEPQDSTRNTVLQSQVDNRMALVQVARPRFGFDPDSADSQIGLAPSDSLPEEGVEDSLDGQHVESLQSPPSLGGCLLQVA